MKKMEAFCDSAGDECALFGDITLQPQEEKNVTLPQGLMVMLEQHQLLTEMSAVIPQGRHHK